MTNSNSENNRAAQRKRQASNRKRKTRKSPQFVKPEVSATRPPAPAPAPAEYEPAFTPLEKPPQFETASQDFVPSQEYNSEPYENYVPADTLPEYVVTPSFSEPAMPQYNQPQPAFTVEESYDPFDDDTVSEAPNLSESFEGSAIYNAYEPSFVPGPQTSSPFTPAAAEQQLFYIPPEEEETSTSSEPQEEYIPQDIYASVSTPEPQPVFESIPEVVEEEPPMSVPEAAPVQSGWNVPEEYNQERKLRGSRQRKTQNIETERESEEDNVAASEKSTDIIGTLKETVENVRTSVNRYGLKNAIVRFLMTFHEHKLALLIASVIFLVIGMIVNRYIAIGYGFILVLIGAFVSAKDEDSDPFILYCFGLAVAFIPFIVH